MEEAFVINTPPLIVLFMYQLKMFLNNSSSARWKEKYIYKSTVCGNKYFHRNRMFGKTQLPIKMIWCDRTQLSTQKWHRKNNNDRQRFEHYKKHHVYIENTCRYIILVFLQGFHNSSGSTIFWRYRQERKHNMANITLRLPHAAQQTGDILLFASFKQYLFLKSISRLKCAYLENWWRIKKIPSYIYSVDDDLWIPAVNFGQYWGTIF